MCEGPESSAVALNTSGRTFPKLLLILRRLLHFDRASRHAPV